MTAFATRRKRRRRIAATAAFTILLIVAAVTGTLWRRGIVETRRAEGANLISLGQLELDSYPTATLAHAIASLERSDSTTARGLALEALWKGPTALVASEDFAWRLRFSPDGRSLVKTQNTNDPNEPSITIFRADGSSTPLAISDEPSTQISLSAISESGHFASLSASTEVDSSTKIGLWSIDHQQPLAETTLGSSQALLGLAVDSSRERLVLLIRDHNRFQAETLGFDGHRENLGTLDFETRRDDSDRWTTIAALDPGAGQRIGLVTDDQVLAVEIGVHELRPPRSVGQQDDRLSRVVLDPLGRFMVTGSKDGRFQFWSTEYQRPSVVVAGPLDTQYFQFTPNGSLFSALEERDDNWTVWVWDTSGDRPRFLRKLDVGGTAWGFYHLDPSGRYISRFGPDTKFRLWPMAGPADAEPIVLHRGEIVQANPLEFNPKADWLATTDLTGLAFWPLGREYPSVIRRHAGGVYGLGFAPDGSWIASSSADGTVRIWPLVGDPRPQGSIRHETDTVMIDLAVSPDGQRLIVGEGEGNTTLLSLDGTPPTVLDGFEHQSWGVAFSHDGRLAAAAGGGFVPADRVIRIWDVASGEEVRVLEVGEPPIIEKVRFLPDDDLISAAESGLLRWDIETGERTLLYEGTIFVFAAGTDGRRVLMVEGKRTREDFGKVVLLDTETGDSTPLEKFGSEVLTITCDPTASIIATGDRDGEVRVGFVDGGEPHLLMGHEGAVFALAIDPLGRWIASGGSDFTVRLWPMPDLSKPPLHTLPREELIAKLKTLTNLRVVRDPESATGWKLTHDPFPGWETVPTW